MKLGIIILAWNSEKRISDCLDSLYIHCAGHKIYVVDNNSDDKTIELVEKNYPEVHLLKSRTNLGFSSGNNFGFQHALADGCDYVLLLNDDVVLLEDFISPLLKKIVYEEKIGAIGPVVVENYDRNVIQSSGGAINKITLDMKYQKKGEIFKRNDNFREVDYILGAAILIRSSLFKNTNLFDPHFYPAYVEEVDLCYRVKMLGYKNVIAENYKIAHIGASSASNNSLTYRRVLNNKILFSLKHQSIFMTLLTTNILLAKYSVNILIGKIKKQ
jgi:GT2 family glycosyltransferase